MLHQHGVQLAAHATNRIQARRPRISAVPRAFRRRSWPARWVGESSRGAIPGWASISPTWPMGDDGRIPRRR